MQERGKWLRNWIRIDRGINTGIRSHKLRDNSTKRVAGTGWSKCGCIVISYNPIRVCYI
jgi:hypothetical protein